MLARLTCILGALALMAPDGAAAIPPGYDAKVVVGKGVTADGSHWTVKAYRVEGQIRAEFASRRGGGAASGGLLTEPECRDIGISGIHGDPKGSIVAGPVSAPVDDVRAQFTSRRGENVAAQTQVVRMSEREAAKVGATRRLAFFVASAAMGIDRFREARATPLDAAGSRLAGRAWFRGTRWGAGPLPLSP